MRYREVGLLAEGGMAIVQKALTADGGEVVVKRVRPPFCFDASYLKLFADEGALHAALQHENILRLLDRGEDECGPYLVFEHVDGVDFACLLEHAEKCGRPLELPAVLAVFVPLMRALAAAHEASDGAGVPLQLVHRDVSPGNILIAEDGSVKLADFGVAASTLRQEATVAGEMKGKFAYMAPEQTRGERVTAQADLFAAGIVLWESLGGRKLFDGPTDADIVHAVRSAPSPSLDTLRQDLPPALVALVSQLLEKDPALRPASARVVADALQEIAFSLALDDGLARHIARAVREAPRRALRDATPDVRRRTQRVLGDTAATGIVVVDRRSRRRIVPLAALGVGALVLVAVTISTVTVTAPLEPRVEQLPDAPAPSPTPKPPPPAVGAPAAIAAPAPVLASAIAAPAPGARPPTPGATRKLAPPAVERPRAPGPAEEGFGTLSIQAEPWAAVYVDGKLVKNETPLFKHTLRAGRHVVRLVNPVYKLEKTIEVDVAPEGDLRRYVDLNQ
jgi:eukaryotic-like serine/threonine-protein kinase